MTTFEVVGVQAEEVALLLVRVRVSVMPVLLLLKKLERSLLGEILLREVLLC